MDRIVYTSHSAISQMALERQAIVNELANVSTPGFKRSFDTAMRTVKVEGPGFQTRYQAQLVARDKIDLAPGPLVVTGQPLDVALQGNTVMGVQSADGELAFSRRGDLRVGRGGVLEDGSGRAVRGQGGPITVPPGLQVSIGPDGTVYARDPQQANAAGTLVDQILLRDASRATLVRRADGLFTPAGKPAGSDFDSGPEQPQLTTGALEGSNVNAVYGMSRMLDHARSFEAQIRAIKEARSLDESGSTLMKTNP